MKLPTDDPFAQGFHAGSQLVAEEAEHWYRSYQIVTMALALSVVVNIVAILWR